MKYTLGRVYIPDDRDKNFPLTKALAKVGVSTRRRRYWWDSAWWGDQGVTPHCFLADTPILMKGGSEKLIAEIKVGDEVITHTGESKKVTQLFKRNYNGTIVDVCFAGRKQPIRCTAEHPFLISKVGPDWSNKRSPTYGKKEIKSTGWKALSEAQCYIGGKTHDAIHIFNGEIVPNVFENDEVEIAECRFKASKSMARLIGLYLAEGYSRRNEINFAFHAKENYPVEVVGLLKKEFGVQAKIILRENSNCQIVHLGRANTTKDIFDLLCGKGSSDKCLHQTIFSWENSLLKEIWLGFLDGDGHTRIVENKESDDTTRLTLTTVSKQLARDLYRIGLRLGYYATLTYSDPKLSHGVKTRRRRYDVNVCQNTNSHERLKTENAFVSSIKDIKIFEKNYKGLVYNIEVEDNHSYIADQAIVHNCVAFSWMHWLEDGPITHFYKTRNFDPSYLNENAKEKHESLFKPSVIYAEAQKVDEWPGECVDTETSCLTKLGWKSFDELVVGEEILTFNLETKMTEWLPLEKVHVYEGANFKIWQNKSIEFACTDNHKWPVRSRIDKGEYRLVETRNWKSQHEFPRVALCSSLPMQSEWSDEFVALVAWVATEGHYRPAKRRGNGIVVSQKVHLQEVARLMESQKVAPGYLKKDGVHVWEISGHLSDQIRLVAPNRAPRIDWLTQLTQRQLELFIDVCVKGDGCVTPAMGNRKERRMLIQKAGPILDSLLAACVLAGQAVSRASHGKGSGEDVESWTLRNSTMVKVRKLPVPSLKNGTVWCPQTQNRTFLARRGKSVFITGNSYDGTSVRAGAKILRSLGVISEYRWAYTLDEVVQSVLNFGPVVVGTSWYTDMFTPDAFGVIKASGQKAGGHAYVINGVNVKKRMFRIKNSWGQTWGKKGRAYISFDDFEKLLKDYGEACIAFEKKLEE